MRVSLSVDGGMASFAGLRAPRSFDSDALSAVDKKRFCSLVEQAHFFTCAVITDPASTPDTHAYTIEIKDGDKHRTLRLREPIADPAMNALLQAVRQRMHTLRLRPDNTKA